MSAGVPEPPANQEVPGIDELTEGMPLHLPSEHEELIAHLERDQLVSGRSVKLPPAVLSPAARAGLWALRIFGLVVSAMVIYTFIAQL